MDNSQQRILDMIKQENPSNPLQYARNIVKDYALDTTKQIIASCEDCTACKAFKELPRGNANASIMIIGGTPESYLAKESFACNYGETKRILDILIDYFQLDEDALFYTNALHCFPSKKIGNQETERLASKKEIEKCLVFVEHLIEIVQPLVIITMGPIALNFFTTDRSLANARGEWYEIKGIPALPTYHPSSFIKTNLDEEIISQQKDELIEDFQKAILYIQEKYPEVAITKG